MQSPCLENNCLDARRAYLGPEGTPGGACPRLKLSSPAVSVAFGTRRESQGLPRNSAPVIFTYLVC